MGCAQECTQANDAVIGIMAGPVKQLHYLIASLAALAVFDRSLRSLRCSLGSRRLRRIRRNDCFGRTGFVLDTFRRLLLQIGSANIGARIAPGCRLLRRRWPTKKHVSSLLLSTAAPIRVDCCSRCARSARIALGGRLLRRRSQTIRRVCSLLLSTAARDPSDGQRVSPREGIAERVSRLDYARIHVRL